MAGIGEASAIIGVVQVGFSLARTLNTYIGDFKDSRESIIGLAAELDATIIQVKELNSLVISSKAASDGSKKLAEKCVKDSDRLIKKLVELLTKAHQPEDLNAIINIKPEDINVSKLTRAYWPLIKPQVDVVKSELHVMKTDILIARSCIQSQAGLTPAERSAGGDSIVALAKSRRLAQRLLQEAKAEERRSAMSSQPRDPVVNRSPDRADGGNGPRVNIPRRRSSGHARYTYGNAADDGRNTELMAQDLRDSIMEDLQREDAERKAKEAADENSRTLAIEAYQKSVKEKLTRLQEATDATQRQIEEIFGPSLDEKQVKMFLSEQQSRQMQDEFGQMLLKFGVMPTMLSKGSAKDARATPEEERTRTARRRWFSRPHSSRSSASSNTGNYRTTNASSSASAQKPAQFLHIALSYDSVEGHCNYQTFDNPAIRHHPCGPPCDFETSMKVWQTVPRIIKQSASKWVEDNHSTRTWHLHAALPIEKNVRKTRSFLQKAILGEIVHRGTSDVLLVFTSTTDSDTSHTDTLDVTEEIKSVSGSQTSAPVSEGAVSRIELSMTDVVQMREWLLNRGVSPAKADHLESLITIRDQVPPKSQQMIYGGDERPAADKAYNLDSDRTVRFADDFAPYSTASAQVPNKLGANNNPFRVEPRSSLYAPRQVPIGSRSDYGRPPPPPPVTIYNARSFTDNTPSRYASHSRDVTRRSRDRDTRYGTERGRSISIDPERSYKSYSSDYYTDATASSRRSSVERERSDNRRGDGYRHYTESRPMRRRGSRAREFETREEIRERERVAARELEREIRELEREREQLNKERKMRDVKRVRERSPQYERERIEVIEAEPSSANEIDLRAGKVGVLRPPPKPVQARTRFGATPNVRFDPSGTAIYDHPMSLSMPHVSETERRASGPSPGLSRLPSRRDKHTDQVHYPRTQQYTHFDYEDGERDFAETRRNSHRSRGAASEDILGWGEMDSWSRKPKPARRNLVTGRSVHRERDAHYFSDDDSEPFRQRHAKRIPTRSNIDTEVLTIRRDLSPEQIREIAEDAEDAMLDDEELKDKMLTRYTSVAAPPLASDSPVGPSNPHGQRETSDDLRHRTSPNSQSPEAGVRRQNTVTIEEIEESNGHASDADTGADRPQDSPKSAIIQPHGVGRTLTRDNKLEKGSDALVVERGTGPETTAPDGDQSLGS